jgi:lysyl-tRNA synthetase class 2
MIADVVDHAREHGIRLVSLNFAAFRALLESTERGMFERAGYQALHLLDPFIRVESLYRFNAKFHPGYLPRGVAFPSWLSVPVVAAAMVGMEFGLVYDRHRAGRAETVPDGQIASGVRKGVHGRAETSRME